MRKQLALFIFMTIYHLTSIAQSNPKKLLQRVIANLDTCHYLYFEAKEIEKNPFSENDTTRSKSAEAMNFTRGVILRQNILRNNYNSKTNSRSIFMHDTLYDIDLNNHLYSIEYHPKYISNSIMDVRSEIEHAIHMDSNKIILRKDTTIDRIPCYNFYINAYDTIENNNHNYTHQFLYISKETYMPIYIKRAGAGNAVKNGYSLGRVSFFSEKHFHNYKFSSSSVGEAFQFDKSGFNIRNLKMLANGTSAPEILVKNLSDNRLVPPSNFENKIILIEFGSTACPANPLANPMLNRLNKEFSSNDLLVVGVYCQETSEQIQNYINHNHIQFPIFLGNIELQTSFQTVGTPNFYLIDKGGKIVKNFDGYNDKLEKQITDEINRLQQ